MASDKTPQAINDLIKKFASLSESSLFALATRAGIRDLTSSEVNQLVFFDYDDISEQDLLSNLRALLTNSVRSIVATGEVKKAVTQSAQANTGIWTSKAAIRNAISAVSTTAKNRKRSTLRYAARSVALSRSDESIQASLKDAQGSATWQWNLPLWHSAEVPANAVEFLEVLETRSWEQDQWQFWYQWLHDVVSGTELKWEVLRAVATIPNSEWSKGASAIAKLIREIEARQLSKLLREDIAVSTSGRLTLVPQPFAETRHLNQLLDIVRDTLELATADMSNGLPENCYLAQKIRRALTRYSNDPQRLEMEFGDSKVGLATEMADQIIPSSSANRGLMQAVADASGSIRESDPEIAANRERLNRIRLREASEEDWQQIADVAVEVAEVSEGVLRDDLLEDRFYLPGARRDDPVPAPIATLGGAERNVTLEAQAAQLRVASRLAKVWLYAEEHPGQAALATLGATGSLASIIGLIVSLV